MAANGAAANRCVNCLHQMIALAKSAGSVPGGSVVAEGTVRGLEPAELERPSRVAVDGRRQVDVEVGAVADGEVLEPEDGSEPGAVSTIVAVPRPKWKSSVPWNDPEAIRRAANGGRDRRRAPSDAAGGAGCGPAVADARG